MAPTPKAADVDKAAEKLPDAEDVRVAGAGGENLEAIGDGGSEYVVHAPVAFLHVSDDEGKLFEIASPRGTRVMLDKKEADRLNKRDAHPHRFQTLPPQDAAGSPLSIGARRDAAAIRQALAQRWPTVVPASEWAKRQAVETADADEREAEALGGIAQLDASRLDKDLD